MGRKAALKLGKAIRKDVKVDLAVVSRWFAQKPLGGAVGAVDTSGEGETLNFPKREIRGRLVKEIPAERPETGPVVEKLLEILQDEKFTRFADRPHFSRSTKGVVDGAQGVLESTGQFLLRIPKFPLTQGPCQNMVPNCFDFLHCKLSIFRYSSKVKTDPASLD